MSKMPMLASIRLKNFKSIQKPIRIELGTITIFIGPNRSGKSSIYQAMGLLKQTPQNQVVWNGEVGNYKDFNYVFNKNGKGNNITIQFGGTTYASAELEHLLGIHKIDFGLTVTINKNFVKEIRFDLGSNRINLSHTAKKTRGRIRLNSEIRAGNITFRLASQPNIHNPVVTDGYTVHNEAEADADRTLEINETVNELLNVFQNALLSCVFIPTIRGFDTPTYSLTDENPVSIPTGEGLTKQAERSASSMAYNRPATRQVSKLIKKVFPGVDISHQLIPKHVEVTSEDDFGVYNIANEGFGLNQLCFLFQQLVLSKEQSTVFIEEPEMALHPAAHIDVCNALLDEIKRVNKQLVISTHSEHVLLSFLDAVRDGRLNSNHLKVYYFERINGATNITPLPVSENGGLKGGMRGFFEADMKHMDSYIDFIKKQK